MLPLLRDPMALEVRALTGTAQRGDIIVFRAGDALVGHRVIGLTNEIYYTAGDSQPSIVETVSHDQVVGIACAVWSDATPQAFRIDGAAFHFWGRTFTRFHGVRSVISSKGRRFMLTLRKLDARSRPRDTPAFIAALRSALRDAGGPFPLQPAVQALAQRHRCTAVLARSSGRNGLQKESIRAKLRALQMQQQVNAAICVLQSINVPFALLKGAARLYSGDPQASDHPSDDIDVLLKDQDIDAACRAFLAAGYTQPYTAKKIDRIRRAHHHAAPLFPNTGGYPIEVHRALAPPGSLSLVLDWAATERHLRPVDGALGKVLCLDDFGSALHLGVHAIGLRRMRDIFILAQHLRRLNSTECSELREFIGRETRDPIRLNASFVLAAWVADLRWPADAGVQRYLDWALRRSDLPRYLRAHAFMADAMFALTPHNFALLTHVAFEKKPETISDWALWPARITKHAVDGMSAAIFAALMPSR